MAVEGEYPSKPLILAEGGVVMRETPTVTTYSLYAEGFMRLLLRGRDGRAMMFRVKKVAIPQKREVLQLTSPV